MALRVSAGPSRGRVRGLAGSGGGGGTPASPLWQRLDALWQSLTALWS